MLEAQLGVLARDAGRRAASCWSCPPTARARHGRAFARRAARSVELRRGADAALRTLARRHGATLFMTLLAGVGAVLARLSGQDDVVVGTPIANRGRAEIEGLIGFFVNTLALRADLSGDADRAASCWAGAGARAGARYAHQDMPFEQVVERVQPAREPGAHARSSR